MLIINAESIVQKGAMSAKVNCIIAILQGAFFFFFTLGGGGGGGGGSGGCCCCSLKLSKLMEFQTMYLVPNNDHNTMYIGQRMTPSQRSLCIFSSQQKTKCIGRMATFKDKA